MLVLHHSQTLRKRRELKRRQQQRQHTQKKTEKSQPCGLCQQPRGWNCTQPRICYKLRAEHTFAKDNGKPNANCKMTNSSPNLPLAAVFGLLSRGCSACQQLESKTKPTTLPVWAALLTTGRNVPSMSAVQA